MSKFTNLNWLRGVVKSRVANRGIGILCGLAVASFSSGRLRADIFPTGCDKASGGQGNTSTTGINFNYHLAHLGDVVQVFPTLGMVGPQLPQTGGGCEALNSTGSVYIASGLLVKFLDNVTLDPGFISQCPVTPLCAPGPYNVTITPALVGAGVSYPEGSIGGAVNTVRALEWSFSSHVRSNPTGFETLDKIDTASITIVHPCILVVKQCVLPNGRTCFNPGEPVVFTGYVTNCGDINLTNVVANDTQTGRLLLSDPVSGLPLPTNFTGGITLTVGSSAIYRASYVPTLVETCLGATTNSVTVTGTDTSDISGPNAFVTNRTSAFCPICVVPGLVVTKACPAQPTPPGGSLIFSGTVTNTGNITLTNVTVVNNQPGPNTPVFGPVTLNPGQGASFTGSYTVPTNFCGPLPDTLTARGSTLCGQGITNTATASCPVVTTPKLALNKICPPTNGVPGGVLGFTGTITNAGDVAVTNIVIVNNVPAPSTPVTIIARLEPGQGAVFSGTDPIPAGVCSLPDTLTATATDVCGHLVSTNASANCPIACLPSIKVYKQVVCYSNVCEPFNADLTTQKTATGVSVGTNCPAFCYRITVTNTGNTTLTSVTVVDNTMNLSACGFPTTLPAGASASCIVAAASHCSTTMNIVTATGTGIVPGGTTNAVSTDTNLVTVVPISVTCQIQILTNGVVVPGTCPKFILNTPYTVRLIVSNNGQYALQNVTVANVAGLCFGTSTNIGSLAINQSTTIDCAYQCTSQSSNYYAANVVAEASQAQGHVCAYNAAGQPIRASTSCAACSACASQPRICVTKEVVCDLPGGCTNDWSHFAIGVKSADGTACPLFCYRIRVTNCGGEDLQNVTVVDNVLNLTNCNFPNYLTAGQTVECILGGVSHCNAVTNTVTATGVGVSSGIQTNAVDTAAVDVRKIQITCTAVINGQTGCAKIPCDGSTYLITNIVQICNRGDVPVIASVDQASVAALGCSNWLVTVSLAPGQCTYLPACLDAVTCGDTCSSPWTTTVHVTAHVDTSQTNLCHYTSGPNGQVVEVTAQSQCSASVCCQKLTCGYTPGYWKNHPQAWPVQQITMGGRVYSKAEAIAIMQMGGPDGSQKVFFQLAATKLNLLIGTPPVSFCIANAIAAGDAFLAQHPPGTGTPASAGSAIISELTAYNEGQLCINHCN